MTVESLYIEAFGMLRDFKLSFVEGMNILEGGNESGKSTIAAFIKFILYGFDIRDGGTERNRRINRTTGTASGQMIISTHEGRWQIERRVTKGKIPTDAPYEVLGIKDLTTGKNVTWPKTPGETLLGVGRDLYECTAFLAKPVEGADDGLVLRQNIEGMLFSPARQETTRAAIEALEAERYALAEDAHNAQSVPRLMSMVTALEARLTTAMSTQREVLRLNHLYEKEAKAAAIAKAQWEKCEAVSVAFQNHIVLIAFEAMHAKEQVYADILEEKEFFLSRHIKCDYLPDAGYRMEYEIRRDEWVRACAATQVAESRLATIEAQEPITPETHKNLLRAEKHGGEVAVYADYKERSKRFTTLLLIAIGCGLLAAGGAVLAILMALGMGGALLWVGVGFAGAGAIACTVLSILAHGKHTLMLALCRDYNAKNGKELAKRLREVSVGRDNAAKHLAALRDARVRLKQAQEDETTTYATLDALLGRWGETLTDCTEIHTYLENFERHLHDTLDTYADITNREGATYAELALMRDSLVGYDEAELRRLVPESRRPMLRETSLEAINEGIERFRSEYQEHHIAACNYSALAETAEAGAENPAVLCEMLCATEDALALQKRRLTAVETSLSLFRNADENLRRELAPKLAYYVRELTDVMTGGKYSHMTVANDLNLYYEEDGESIPLSDLSAGTRDAAYLALRLAIIRLLFREAPPVCFDDSFAEQDDKRLQSILQVLIALSRSGNMQTVLFTRQDREYRLAGAYGACHKIVLD